MTEMVSIILAGGAQTRMGEAGRRSKACCEIGGLPVILRALRTYQECGIRHHVIVVGEHGVEIMRTIAPHFDNVSYAFQHAPLGTGHAARVGASVLKCLGFGGDILVAACDKLVDRAALQRLVDRFKAERCDAALLVSQLQCNPSGGRIIRDRAGDFVGIVEANALLLVQALADLESLCDRISTTANCRSVLRVVAKHTRGKTTPQKLLGSLYDILTRNTFIPVSELRLRLAELEQAATIGAWWGRRGSDQELASLGLQADEVNESVYLFKAEALFAGLSGIRMRTVPREEFFTDALGYLACHNATTGQPHKVVTVRTERPDEVLTFNTPEELARADRVYRERLRLESGGSSCAGQE